MIALLVVACVLAYLTLGLVSAAVGHHMKWIDLTTPGEADVLAVAIVLFWPAIDLVGACAFVAAWLSGTAVRMSHWWTVHRFNRGMDRGRNHWGQ